MVLALWIVATILTFSVMIVFCQSAFAIVGRQLGATVETIGIGWGPMIARRTYGAIEFKLHFLPFGGYTKFFGDEIGVGALVDVEDRLDEFDHASREPPVPFNQLPVISRAAVILSGPVTSLLFGLGLTGAAMLLPDSEVVVDRAAQIPIAPTAVPELGIIGRPASFESQNALFRETFVEFWHRLVTFQSLSGWGGFLGALVTCAVAGITSLGAWISCIGVLCVGFAFFNLLPLPSLNGGELLLLAAESVFGRPSDRLLARVAHYGIFASLLLMAVILFLDAQWLFIVWRG